jgi:hypothetical protein
VEYLDKLAEAAVKEAIQKVVADGKRANSQSVPPVAQQLLRQKGPRRVSESEAQKRVAQAVDRLRVRKEIKAPQAPYNDWGVIDYRPAAAKEAAPQPRLDPLQ